jgi:hypothetical protein
MTPNPLIRTRSLPAKSGLGTTSRNGDFRTVRNEAPGAAAREDGTREALRRIRRQATSLPLPGRADGGFLSLRVEGQ